MEWLHYALADGALYLQLLMALLIVNLLPPVPAEVIIPISASLFADRTFDTPLAIAAATTGLVLGTLPWYYLGRSYGEERFKEFLRYRSWLAVTPKDIERSGRWFRRYGGVIVLLGRIIPGMRTLVSIPAGFHRMRLGAFLIWTVAGSALWASFLVMTGHWLSQFLPGLTTLHIFMAMLIVFGLFYIYRISTL